MTNTQFSLNIVSAKKYMFLVSCFLKEISGVIQSIAVLFEVTEFCWQEKAKENLEKHLYAPFS